MSSNLLLYSQIQEDNENLKAQIVAAKAGGGGGTTWNPSSWTSLPMLKQSTITGELVVGHTSGIAGCGATCTWTVPAGATKAQFQVWGAGANGTSGECCGIGFAGGNGAYATIIIDVNVGDSYALTAGCSLCCCIHYGAISGFNSFSCIAAAGGDATALNACPSFVTGNGLTNFCAEGARQWDICRWFEAATMQIHNVDDPATISAIHNCSCFFNYKSGSQSGQNTCYGVYIAGGAADTRAPWFCNQQAQASVPMGGPLCIPFVKECCSNYYGTTSGITGYYPASQWHMNSFSQGQEWKIHGRWCYSPTHAERENCGEWNYYHWTHFGSMGSGQTCNMKPGCVSYHSKTGIHGRGGDHGMACGGGCGGGNRGYGGAVRVSWC